MREPRCDHDLAGIKYELKIWKEAVEFVRNGQEKKEKKNNARYVNGDSEKLMFMASITAIYEKYNPPKLSDLEKLFANMLAGKDDYMKRSHANTSGMIVALLVSPAWSKGMLRFCDSSDVSAEYVWTDDWLSV